MIIYVSGSPSVGFTITVDRDDMAKFQELIQRGANLWPDAPADIKALADIITNGKIMQDYTAQEHPVKDLPKDPLRFHSAPLLKGTANPY